MNLTRVLVLAASVLATIAPWIDGNVAAAADEPAATVLLVDSMPAQDERGKSLDGQYWISVSLSTEDGRYVANRTIQVVEPVDFFGKRDAVLGSAVTDETGFAAIVYQPSQPGEHRIVARFGGDKLYAKSRSELTIDASNVVSPFIEEELPLASVGRNLSLFLGGLGIAFWAFVLLLLGRTAVRIARAPQKQTLAEPVAVVPAQSQEVRI